MMLIVVQARMSSSRLPGKIMKDILGETVLYRQLERLQKLKNKVTLVVATSEEPADDAVRKFCEEKNFNCFRGSLNNLLDRHYKAMLHFDAEACIKIPSDCPLIDPRIVDEVIDFYKNTRGAYDFVGNLHPATFPDGNDVEIMTRACLTRTWKEATRPLELEHTTPYIWENPEKFRLANITCSTGRDYSMSHRFTIDYEADYQFIKRVYEELYPTNPNFSCADILNLLERQPEIYNINSRYAGVNWYRNHLDELKTIDASATKKI